MHNNHKLIIDLKKLNNEIKTKYEKEKKIIGGGIQGIIEQFDVFCKYIYGKVEQEINQLKKQNNDLQKRNTELVLENRKLINELPSPGCSDDNLFEQIKTLQSMIDHLRQDNIQFHKRNKDFFEENNRLKNFIKENL